MSEDEKAADPALELGDEVWVLAEVKLVWPDWSRARPVTGGYSIEVNHGDEGRTWRRDPLPDADAAYERGRAEATKVIVADLRAKGRRAEMMGGALGKGAEAALLDASDRYERGEHLAGKGGK